MTMNNNYISEFLTYLETNLNYSDNTIYSYDSDLNKLNEYYKKKDLLKLTYNDLIKYIESLDDMAPTSISRNISSIKTFYTYFVKTNKILSSPADLIKEPKLGTHLPTYLTNEEIDKLLDIDVTDKYSARNKAILELMYASGLRISEVVSLELMTV